MQLLNPVFRDFKDLIKLIKALFIEECPQLNVIGGNGDKNFKKL